MRIFKVRAVVEADSLPHLHLKFKVFLLMKLPGMPGDEVDGWIGILKADQWVFLNQLLMRLFMLDLIIIDPRRIDWVGQSFISLFINLIRSITVVLSFILLLHHESSALVDFLRFAVEIFLSFIVKVAVINVFVSVFFFPLIDFVYLEFTKLLSKI